MSIFTNFFNALMRAFGYVDSATNRDPLLFIALVVAVIALYYALQAKGRIAAAANSSMNKIVNDRLQEVSIKVGDLNSKLTTTVTEQEKTLQMMRKKVTEMEQTIKKLYSGAETAALKFDDGFDFEIAERVKRLEEVAKHGEGGDLSFQDPAAADAQKESSAGGETPDDLPEDIALARQQEQLNILCEPISKSILATLKTLPKGANGAVTDERREAFAKLTADLKSFDFGDELSGKICEALSPQLSGPPNKLSDISASLHQAMRAAYGATLRSEIKAERVLGRAPVICLIGEKSVGKSLLAVRLTLSFLRQDKRVLLATTEQLTPDRARQIDKWSHAHDVPVVFGSASKKPQAVAYQSIHKALDENCDIVILEVGGAAELKQNREDLQAVLKMVQREQPGAPHEVLLVVDATQMGQLDGARELVSVTPITGICVTKLDKAQHLGGVLKLRPLFNAELRYLSIGSTAEDVAPFSLDRVTDALVGETEDGAGAAGESESSRAA